MRKHNEGYALVLVLVTMVVLSIVAVSLMSMGLRNLKAQQAVGERMADKYAAQGKIEVILAKLSQTVEKEIVKNVDASDSGGSGETTETDPQDLEARLKTYVSDWVKEQSGVTDVEVTLPETVNQSVPNGYSCIIALKAAEGTADIECQLRLKGKITETIDAHGKTTCKIEPEEPEYLTYVISHTSAAESTEGGEAQ